MIELLSEKEEKALFRFSIRKDLLIYMHADIVFVIRTHIIIQSIWIERSKDLETHFLSHQVLECPHVSSKSAHGGLNANMRCLAF